VLCALTQVSVYLLMYQLSSLCPNLQVYGNVLCVWRQPSALPRSTTTLRSGTDGTSTSFATAARPCHGDKRAKVTRRSMIGHLTFPPPCHPPRGARTDTNPNTLTPTPHMWWNTECNCGGRRKEGSTDWLPVSSLCAFVRKSGTLTPLVSCSLLPSNCPILF
jgi:hypothetical protein